MLKVNGKLLLKKTRFAKTPWQRARGLMFEDKKKFDYALVFEFPKESKLGASLHMIFVFFPIDALFLDKNKKVVDKATLYPFNPNYTPKRPAKFVVEMPQGRAAKVEMGDRIDWKSEEK